MQDGRKSFRAISREMRVSTPTVKARYERLVNIGLIKSIKPEIDVSKIVDSGKQSEFTDQTIEQLGEQKKHFEVKIDGIRVKMEYEYCGGPINGKPKVLALANFERYFCRTGCKNHYREKHAGRIPSIVEQYKEMRKEANKLYYFLD